MIISPLEAWLSRQQPIPDRFVDRDYKDTISSNWISFIGIEESASLSKANELSWKSLQNSRSETRDYLDAAAGIINGLEGGWLDSEECIMIKESIGLPPIQCLPIYIITTANKSFENIVYIGKTENKNRFSNGHLAALKLHDPKYKHFDK